jgi:nucleotide-binding universal stress UspA family protein
MTGPPRCIIVPVTFPRDAREVVGVAAAFAGALGAELVLAGIAPLAPPEPQRYGPEEIGPIARQREQHADLIVVPMLREGELRHLLHDHADRHVLHHSDVPVLIVPVPSVMG